MTLKKALIIYFLIFLTGCTSVGNILITPHPDSLRSGSAEIEFEQSTEVECIPPPPPPVSLIGAGAVLGVAVSGVVKLLEEESEQYKASYSATSYGDIKSANCLHFKRKNKEKKFFDFNIYIDKHGSAFRLKVEKPQVTGFKSKIASWPLLTAINGVNPWSGDSWSSKIGNTIGWVNPLMILHAMYSVFDQDVYTTDIKVKLRIDSVANATIGIQPSLINVGSVEIETGKFSVFDINHNEIILFGSEPFETGYLALSVDTTVPSNIVITVIEGNDFGNIIGKGAEQVGKKKEGIIDKLIDILGG